MIDLLAAANMPLLWILESPKESFECKLHRRGKQKAKGVGERGCGTA